MEVVFSGGCVNVGKCKRMVEMMFKVVGNDERMGWVKREMKYGVILWVIEVVGEVFMRCWVKVGDMFREEW